MCARAVALACSLPGYRAEGAGRLVRHLVPVSGDRLATLAQLLELVRGWRSTTLLADDLPLERARLWARARVLSCYRERGFSGLESLHCWGLPGTTDARVPCRLVDRALPWTFTGAYRDRAILPRLLLAHAREALVETCPAYDHAALTLAAFEQLARPPARGDAQGLPLRVALDDGSAAAEPDGRDEQRARLERLLDDVDFGSGGAPDQDHGDRDGGAGER